MIPHHSEVDPETATSAGGSVAAGDLASQQSSPFACRKWVRPVSPVAPASLVQNHARGVAPPATSGSTTPGPESRGPKRPAPPEPASTDSARARRGAAIGEGLRWTIISRPISEAVSLLASGVLARLVVPDEFGRYTIALVVLGLANVPTQAVSYTLVQRDKLAPDHLRTGLTLTVILGLAICALVLAGDYAIVGPLFGERTAFLVRLMIPACFLNSVNTVPLAMLSRRLQFRRLSLIDITITFTGAIAGIAMAAAGMNAAAMVLATSVGTAAGIVLLCIWAPPPMPNFSIPAARDLLTLGVPAASAAASQVCFWNCDYMIVSARLGALQAGYYFRAYTLGVQYQTKITQLLSSLGFPVLSRASTADEVEAMRRRMVHVVTIPLFPLLALLAIIAPRFVPWFYGPAWRPAVPVVQILTIGGAAMCVASALGVAMLASGRPRAVMHWGWGHFAVYACAVYALTRVGLGAVAVGAAVVHTGFLLICYLLLVRGSVRNAARCVRRDLLPAVASCIGLAAVALPASAAASALHMPTLPALVVVSIAGAIGYIITLRVCFPRTLASLGPLARRVLPAKTMAFVARLAPRQVQTVS